MVTSRLFRRFHFSLQKSLNTSCDLMFSPCSHEFSKYVVVFAVIRMRTVLLHHPGHLVLLYFLHPCLVIGKASEIVTPSCM